VPRAAAEIVGRGRRWWAQRRPHRLGLWHRNDGVESACTPVDADGVTLYECQGHAAALSGA
jgi:hypothetical protein